MPQETPETNPLFAGMSMEEAADLSECYPSVQEAKRREAAQRLAPEFLDELQEWQKLSEDLALMTAREKEMRQRIFDAAFPKPTEGTNKFDLAGGYQLSASYKINRTIDKAVLSTVEEMLKEQGLDINDYIRFKPELETKAYKTMSSDKQKILDLAITAKPGLPSLEIVLPKRGKK